MKAPTTHALVILVLYPCSAFPISGGNTCKTNEDCDDGNICTQDVCQFMTCENIPLTVPMDLDGIYCNGVDECVAGVHVPGMPPWCTDGNVCTDDYCDEDLDVCAYANNDNPCNDLDLCTENDNCHSGVCTGTPIHFCDKCIFDSECDDFLDCTVNTCDQVDGVCRYIPDDSGCADDGVFCNGAELCVGAGGDPETGCASAGSPCEDCTERSQCGCPSPIVQTAASRYIEVDLPVSDNRYAIVVWTCEGTNPQYVGAWPEFGGPMPIDLYRSNDPVDIHGSVAHLVDDADDALYLTPDEWFGTVWITGLYVIADGTFDVAFDCGSPGEPDLSTTVEASTNPFGDVDGNQVMGLSDTLQTVLAFQGLFVEGNSRVRSDLAPCLPDMRHNMQDVQVTIFGFLNLFYEEICDESTNCP